MVDFLGENEMIWSEMTEKRGDHAALVGSSVHNQPIESLWNYVNDRVTEPFRILFDALEKEGWLDVENETDIMILHHVFLTLIQVNYLYKFVVCPVYCCFRLIVKVQVHLSLYVYASQKCCLKLR